MRVLISLSELFSFKITKSRLTCKSTKSTVWYFLQSLKSRGYVKEQFAWRHHYWYLTNEGIQYLRDFLHLPPEIVPSTLKRQARAETARPRGRGQYFSFIGCCDLTFHSRVLHCNYLTSCSPFIYMYIAKKKCHTHTYAKDSSIRQEIYPVSGL